ncbi:MAG: metallophosphoesterase [Deltaproteobacteria bacterium]|nr:metallophosphoesterase [Deltaproteobacteria bacterium]
MRVFAIGDLHLSSRGKTMDIFGPQWRNHEERLFENWSRTVRPDDTVLVAGDLSWALKLDQAIVDLERLGKLPGTKILVRGNHDYWWSSRAKVNAVLPQGMIAINASAWTRDRLSVVGTRGWNIPGAARFDDRDERIYLREVNRLRIALEQAPQREDRKLVAVLHYPPLTRAVLSSGFTELLETFQVAACVYAHLHGDDQKIAFQGTRNGVTYIFAACDYLDFQPVELEL